MPTIVATKMARRCQALISTPSGAGVNQMITPTKPSLTVAPAWPGLKTSWEPPNANQKEGPKPKTNHRVSARFRSHWRVLNVPGEVAMDGPLFGPVSAAALRQWPHHRARWAAGRDRRDAGSQACPPPGFETRSLRWPSSLPARIICALSSIFADVTPSTLSADRVAAGTSRPCWLCLCRLRGETAFGCRMSPRAPCPSSRRPDHRCGHPSTWCRTRADRAPA